MTRVESLDVADLELFFLFAGYEGAAAGSGEVGGRASHFGHPQQGVHHQSQAISGHLNRCLEGRAELLLLAKSKS